MSAPRNELYLSRFIKHVCDARMHLGQFDYVQASEKVWGAMSSLVNAKSSFDITGVRQKKEAFESLFKRLCVKYAHLRKTLKDCHFRDAYDLATKAEGLHLYFFGGRFYPDYFMKTVIEDCVKVFEEVEKVV